MPRVQLDLTKVEPVGRGGGFKPLPADQGPYVLRCTAAEVGKSKNNNDMVIFDFEVVENDGTEDCAGRTFRQWYPLMDKQPMAGRMLALANACEVEYDRSGFDTDNFLDAVFACDLTIETTDQGGEFNRIENPRPVGGDEGAEDDPGEDANPPDEPPAPAPTRRAPSRATTRSAAPKPPRRSVR